MRRRIDKCRLCLRRKGEIAIFSEDGTDYLSIAKRANLLFGISICFEEVTNSPLNLCSGCSVRLTDTYEFYKVVKNANEILQTEQEAPQPEPPKRRRKVRKSIVCNECGETFRRKLDLDVHERHHTGERPFKCDICQGEFIQKYHLKDHMKMHITTNQVKCRECGKLFLDKYRLASHRKYHANIRRHFCPWCDKTFVSISDFNKHQRIHTGEKPYECKYCKKRDSDASNMRKHERFHERQMSQV